MLPLILDGVIILLLLATIITASTLSARLKVLKESRNDFMQMVNRFDDATAKADAGVKALQASAKISGSDLQDRLTEAHALRDELSVMIASAESLARRLENAAGRAGGDRTSSTLPAASVSEATPSPDPRSKAERDLLRAMIRKDGQS